MSADIATLAILATLAACMAVYMATVHTLARGQGVALLTATQCHTRTGLAQTAAAEIAAARVYVSLDTALGRPSTGLAGLVRAGIPAATWARPAPVSPVFARSWGIDWAGMGLAFCSLFAIALAFVG